jgi:uncharacterized phage protein (TIGR02220 family)
MKNFIPINRKLFNHYLWTEKRSYSKFEAWLDLLQMVSFEDNNELMINGSLCKWGRGQFPISISYLCNRWDWSSKKVRTYLKLLKKERMVDVDTGNKWTMLTICKYDSYNTKGQAKGNPEASKGQQLNKVNNIIINIIAVLNEETGKAYRRETTKTRDLINARLNEGFTYDDFETVIRNKSRDWKNDPKMSKFLRPETLFGNKFEGYLNESKTDRKKAWKSNMVFEDGKYVDKGEWV